MAIGGECEVGQRTQHDCVQAEASYIRAFPRIVICLVLCRREPSKVPRGEKQVRERECQIGIKVHGHATWVSRQNKEGGKRLIYYRRRDVETPFNVHDSQLEQCLFLTDAIV